MKINFIGATQDVTGSMTLLEATSGRFLIDSGLYQGISSVTQKNMLPLPFNPKDINAIFLTHAHLDHSGFIPRLIKLGFRGKIFCTRPTMKLATVIINDSAQILEKSETHPLKNFYTLEDASIVTSLFKTVDFDKPFSYMGLTVTFSHAGHILGASSIHISEGDKSIVFSGDLGRHDDVLLPPPTSCPPANVVVMESTYGDKVRHVDLEKEMKSFLNKVKSESRVAIVASFAVARAQMLITMIHKYFQENPSEAIPLFIDGPMMVKANKIYREYASQTKSPDELSFALEEVDIIEHTRQWESLRKKKGPLLIITSSGMVTGGRIWRYLENWQDDSNALLFLPGYQGVGTPGKALSEGKHNIQNEEGKIIHWSGEVLTSQSFSSHADQSELVEWLKDVSKDTKIFLNHGEAQSKEKLKKLLLEMGFQNCFMAENSFIEI